ncbi:MAG TPA: hypothetical protein VI636_25250 [Candidatus Angelobacter sp.]
MPRTTGPIQRLQAPPARFTGVANTPVRTNLQTNVAVTPVRVAPGAMTTPIQSTAAASCCCPVCGGLECLDRTRFFSGQLLTEADLNNEQSYLLAKNRLHNRYLFGSGVVCGLQVTCSPCDGWVNINPGYAIDPCGNDIIVCTGQSFNVLQAIQACCAPQPTTDCSPLRYRPAATCQDAVQTWCITIQYQEQQSQMVTPLQPMQSGSSACGCGCGSNNSCTCGSGSSKSNGCGCGNGSSASSSGSSATTSSSAAACEATRILEGYQLGVCQQSSAAFTAPQPGGALTNTNIGTFTQQSSPQPGTFDYQFLQCYLGLFTLLLQRPTLKDANGNVLSDAQAYQATSQYLTSVQNAYASALITHCSNESALDAITVPAPPHDNYIETLRHIIVRIARFIVDALLDCLCSSLLPPCPGPVCDNRLILACMTVKDGKITNICHFGSGRKQVVTFPALYYWLSIFGFDKALAGLGDFLELVCCGEGKQRATFFNGDYNSRAVFLTGSSGNPAMVNHAMSSFLAQKMGATVVNTASDTAHAVDLRPLVGLDTEKARAMLESYGIKTEGTGFVKKEVSTDPAWTDNAVAAGATYAPAAFDATKPLTMFYKGSVVVGFDITSPTDVLSAQIADLQKQFSNLSTQFNTMQTPPGNVDKKP